MRQRFAVPDFPGAIYGRGTQDMKSGDAILVTVTTLIRLRKENFKPNAM
jgi:hypothetical protein